MKGNIENCLSNNYEFSYKNNQAQTINSFFNNNSALIQTDNQEITNLQYNNRNNNSINDFKIHKLISKYYVFKNFSKHFSNRNIFAFNFEHIIYTRAP